MQYIINTPVILLHKDVSKKRYSHKECSECWGLTSTRFFDFPIFLIKKCLFELVILAHLILPYLCSKNNKTKDRNRHSTLQIIQFFALKVCIKN